MIVGRLIGWIFLIAALAVVAYEAITFSTSETGDWKILGIAELVAQIHPPTLVGFGGIFERTLGVPEFYNEYIVQGFLLWPAWAFLGGLGILFLVLFRVR